MRLTAILLLAVLVLPGCIQGDDSTSTSRTTVRQTQNGETRERGSVVMEGDVGGSKAETKKIDVPRGASRLVVSAEWSVGGTAYFKLARPGGAIAKDDLVQGGETRGRSEWFTVANPTPGTWELHAEVNGGVRYRFEAAY